MLCDKNDSQSYTREFQKRFNNFAEKAPILLSYSIHPKGVSIIDESKQNVYEFDWDYTIPVKSFIHGIKEVLSENAYPVITHILRKEEPITETEAANLIASGVEVDQVPETKILTSRISYRIDKVIVFKDIFILKDLRTGKMFRYKLNKSSVFFLKRWRSNQDPLEAGSFFFEHATFLNEIESRDEDGSER